MPNYFRILITDDNEAIHEDIESILGQSKMDNSDLDNLDAELFGNDPQAEKAPHPNIVEYNIDHAFSGEEAIKKVAQAEAVNEPYALLFMDVRMPPGMDGIVTVQKIWEKYPNTQVIICSAYSDYSWDQIIKVYGKTDKLMFLQKPFNRIAIQQMTLSMVTKWELQNELYNLVKNLDEKVDQRTRELKIAVEEMNRARKRTEQAAAVAAAQRVRSEFLSVMGHELRTPLNAILGFSDLLAPHLPEGKPGEYLKAIKSSGKALITLVNDILEISKMENGKVELKYEPVQPRQILNSIKETYEPIASQKQLHFSLSIDNKLPQTLQLDGRRLRQTLVNLVGNAVKFTHKGGIKLSVSAVVDEKKPARCHLNIVVEDTGVGIPKNQLSKIFEAFTQKNSADARGYEGVGLGLTISKRLVSAMNGKISVSSIEGRGSRFTIALTDVEVVQGGNSTKLETAADDTGSDATNAGNWENQPFPETSAPKELQRLRMVLAKLEGPIMKKWETVFETMVTGDIQRFGEGIQKMGGELNIKPLQQWGQMVADYAGNFQIEEMNSTMARYPDLIKKFAGTLNKP